MAIDPDEANALIATHTREVSALNSSADPMISVCLVTFDHAAFIREAIDSVLAQMGDYTCEIIVGDDCSTDGTTDIVLAYQRMHAECIRVLLADENLGRFTGNGRLNLIRTLRACRGKYIATLEGDDYWTSKDKLQAQVGFLETHSLYAGSCHRAKVVGADVAVDRVFRSFSGNDLEVEDTLDTLAAWHTSTFVFRRACLELPPWFLNVIVGDRAMFAIVAGKGLIRAFPHVMSAYRKHPRGLTARPGWARAYHEDAIALLDHLDQHFAGRYHSRIEAVKARERAELEAMDGLRDLIRKRQFRRALARGWQRLTSPA